MKKNKIFSRGLFVEGMRLSRSIAIPYLAIVAIIGVIDALNSIRYGEMGFDATGAAGLISFCAVVPLMCLTLFHYLNSRRASDFFHSLAHSRTCVYVSFCTAILTWAVAGMALGLIFNFGSALFTPMFTPMVELSDAAALLRICLLSVVACIQVLSAVMIAMSICSSVATQVIVSLLVIFMPRGLLNIILATVENSAPIIYRAGEVGWFFNNAYNIAFSTVTGGLFGSDWVFEMDNIWGPVAYTLVLSAIYCAIGLICFNRRRSEMATATAPNGFVQMLIRTMTAFVFCLYPCYDIASGYHSQGYRYLDDTEYVMWFGLALVAYIVYEIISRKSLRGVIGAWKNMLAGLLLLAAVSAGLVICSDVCVDGILSIRPQPKDIISVSLPTERASWATYGEVCAQELKLDDPRVIEAFSKQLDANIEGIKKNTFVADCKPNEIYNLVSFELKNGKTITRKVYFSYLQNERLNKLLSGNEDLMNALYSLPSTDEIDSISLGCVHNESEAQELYRVYYDEINSLDNADKSAALDFGLLYGIGDAYCAENGYDVGNMPAYYDLGDFDVSGEHNGVSFNNTCHISGNLPKTAEKYIEIVNRSNTISFEEAMKAYEECDWGSLWVDGGNLFDADGNYVPTETFYCERSKDNIGGAVYEDVSSYDISENTKNELIAELLENYGKPVDACAPLYHVLISACYYEGEDENFEYKDFDFDCFIPASEIDPTLLKLVFSAEEYDFSNYDAPEVSASDAA